jgi:hypothetical protein
MKIIHFNKWMAIAALPMLTILANSTQASVIFYLDETVNNKIVVPGTTSTWASVTIDDRGSVGADGVSLRFSISNALSSNSDTIGTFISSWYLNYKSDKTINYDKLVVNSGKYESTPTILITQNGLNSPVPFQGAPSNFDLGIEFGNKGGAKGQFGVGDTVTLYFTGTMTANDFNFLNNTNPTQTNGLNAKLNYDSFYHTIAEVQGFLVNGKPTSSTYTSIPETSAGVLSMLTATVCGVFARKRRDLQV